MLSELLSHQTLSASYALDSRYCQSSIRYHYGVLSQVSEHGLRLGFWTSLWVEETSDNIWCLESFLCVTELVNE